jgi:hypothetical protein
LVVNAKETVRLLAVEENKNTTYTAQELKQLDSKGNKGFSYLLYF